MKLDEIIASLSSETQVEFPTEALLSARDNWSELLPVINELMQKFIVKERLTEAEANLLFFGVCLIVDRKQFSCYEALINLTNKDDFDSPLDDLLGDFLTSSLSTAYYILAQGGSAQLCRLITSDDAGEYVKMAAMGTLFAQLDNDQIDRDTLNRYVPGFIDNLLANHQAQALFCLANHLISYQFNQYQAQFVEYVSQGVIDEGTVDNQTIIDWDNFCIGSSDWHNGLIKGSYDIIEELCQWSGFAPEADMRDEELMEIFDDLMNTPNELDYMDIDSYELQQPYIADIKVGRNEPCPCGSGKKYKKCCMG